LKNKVRAIYKRHKTRVITVTTVLLAVSTQAHATVMDSMGNYLYGGFTGPLAKSFSVCGLILGIVGMRNSEGNAFKASATAAGISGAVLAAPVLVTEFQNVMSGVLVFLSW
jgi:hypothetical protein